MTTLMRNRPSFGKKTRALAAAVAVTAGLSVTACTSDDDADDGSAGQTTAEQTQETEPLPTAEELGVIIDRAVDPELSAEEKVDTVENGEEAAELFDVMTASQQDSGASFEVVEPVLQGLQPETVEVTMMMHVPEQEPQQIQGVEFVQQDGQWKLSQAWACTLVSNVAPDQVPASCEPFLDDAPDEGMPEEDMPEDMPAEEPAV